MIPAARVLALLTIPVGLGLCAATAAGWAADETPAPAAQPAAVAAPQASLMFSPDEAKAIEQAIQDHLHPPAAQVAAQAAAAAASAAARGALSHVPNIYVSAVLDFGGGDWTVWANGLQVTPDHQPPLFHVAAVDGNTVDIVVTAENGIRIRLQPYQTWRSRERDVVEGIVP